jgi:hypothetical protein
LISWACQQSSWAIGFLDEVWWSRFALPHIHAWQAKDQPVRLVEQPWKKGDPDPKAFACYGVHGPQGSVADPIRKQMSLLLDHRASGQRHYHPVSGVVLQEAASTRQNLLAAHLG